MRCVNAPCQIEDIVKKSRFIGIIAPCQTEQAILKVLTSLQMEHPTASHIAFAYRILTQEGIRYRFHDAGEPSGTAGKPIYQHLEGKDLINVLVVAIRYFGGVKLGAGGLTRAYSNAAGRAIEHAAVVEYVPMCVLRATLDYSQLPNFEYQLKKYEGNILQQDFAEQIRFTVEIPQTHVAALLQNVTVQCNHE